MKRHIRENFYVVDEGILTFDEKHLPTCQIPSTIAALRKFRFSRLGPKGTLTDEKLRIAVAEAMTTEGKQEDSAGPTISAGFTYLGQFADHDLTMDNAAASLGENVTVAELVQGRSPALDLDSLYGRGPQNPEDAKFYSDGVLLKMGTTAKTAFPPGQQMAEMMGVKPWLPIPPCGFTSCGRQS